MRTSRSGVDWYRPAAALADRIADPSTAWHAIVSDVPRHRFIPRWWTRDGDGWGLRTGAPDPAAWAKAAYADRTLVTRIGPDHADHATPWDRPCGRPTSSATEPGLLLRLYGHARLADHHTVLDIGTGSGYGAALLARRYGHQATTVDVDPYLVDTARERLHSCWLTPRVEVADALGPLPGTYDRIIATVAPPGIPPSWVDALRPGGRLVTTLADIPVILTGTKQPDGSIAGRIAWDRAAFMHTRTAPDYAPPLVPGDGSDHTRGRHPVVDVREAWELWGVHTAENGPGITHRHTTAGDLVTASMAAPDGSWAVATGRPGRAPDVTQGGPRRLWDALDTIRDRWLADGQLHLYGARATVDPDGTLHLARGGWTATVPPADPTTEPR